MLAEIPMKLFEIRLKGQNARKMLKNLLGEIIETEIISKGGNLRGYIVGQRDDEVIIITNAQLENKEHYEVRFLSGRGIVTFRTQVLEQIPKTTPPIYIMEPPREIMLCERRKYHRIKVEKDSEVIIKRDSGYAFYCSLADISLGGFSALMTIKDKMIEYFLPMIDEEVKFSLRIIDRKHKLDLEGRAKLKHYSIDAHGKYRAGFSFSNVEKKKIKKMKELSSFLKKIKRG